MALRDPQKVTVVIATYNSEETLPKTLQSLRAQEFPAEKLEILVADGGSSDRTRSIAIQFGAEVIDNPRTVPGWAKFLGLHAARGKAVVFLDSDEVFLHTRAIHNIMHTFRENPEVHLVGAAGYHNPAGYPFINAYINEFGDPFSFFIYRLSKDYRFFLPTMKRRYKVVKDDEASVVFDFAQATDYPLIEMYAGGVAIDVDFFEREFPEQFNDSEEFSHLFNFSLDKASCVAIAKHTDVVHYSSDSLEKFLSKVRWRIKSNIAFRSLRAKGFLGRLRYQKSQSRLRAALFLPYCFLIFPVTIEAILLVITRRDIRYLAHIYFSIYTAILIVTYFAMHKLGWRPELSAYGTSVSVSSVATEAERK